MKSRKTAMEYGVLLLALAMALMCFLSATLGSAQASSPLPMPQELIGEYSTDGETWFPLTDDSVLSAGEESLFLRGHFLREIQEGWQLNYYRNHIGVSISVNGSVIRQDAVSTYAHMPVKVFSSMCGREWSLLVCPAISTEDLVEIRLLNPHAFGNESAYRDFLNTLCVNMPVWDLLKPSLFPYGQPLQIFGILLSITALVLLGSALAAAAARMHTAGHLLKLGLLTLFTGGFVMFDTINISLLNELNAANTYGRQLCMMLGVLCLGFCLCDSLTGRRRSTAQWICLLSAAGNSILFLLSLANVMVIYDTLPYWVGIQAVFCPVLFLCCLLELRSGSRRRLHLISGLMLLAALAADLSGFGSGLVLGSPWFKLTFALLYPVHLFAGAAEILRNHRASLRAATLEKELEDSRIAIMLSQIKPHFLYNVLNTIYHLYRREPETAQEALSSFAEYLRCNMLSIEKRELIPFSEEYQHVQTYLSLEQIRFRGKLDVVYDVEVSDFRLPPLTVEPLVENAVKHGVTKKRGGGIVTIATRKTPEGYTITVSDTGIGFDPNTYQEDGKPHVGIRNVRDRLKNMAGGTLTITSSPDGTVAVVTIPAKEGTGTK